MLQKNRFVVYGGTGNHRFDAAVLRLVNNVTNLGLGFSHCWHNTWPDGEPGFRMENPQAIKGRHALIFSCPVNHKLVSELKDLLTACKHQYGATSVTAVLSFLRFRRQDHEEFEHEITRLRWFIRDLKHWGADALVVCEPHSLENTLKYCAEFGLKLHLSDPTRLFAEAIASVVQTLGGQEKVRVYSPDLGSIERSLALAKLLGVGVLATPKRRINTRVELVDGEDFLRVARKNFGTEVPISCDLHDLSGLHLFMRDDEIDSGSTAVTTVRRLHEVNAQSVNLITTHPVCSRGWKMRFFPEGEQQPFANIWLGNTRPRGDGETDYEGSTGGRIQEVDIAPAVAGTLSEVLSQLAG